MLKHSDVSFQFNPPSVHGDWTFNKPSYRGGILTYPYYTSESCRYKKNGKWEYMKLPDEYSEYPSRLFYSPHRVYNYFCNISLLKKNKDGKIYADPEFKKKGITKALITHIQSLKRGDRPNNTFSMKSTIGDEFLLEIYVRESDSINHNHQWIGSQLESIMGHCKNSQDILGEKNREFYNDRSRWIRINCMVVKVTKQQKQTFDCFTGKIIDYTPFPIIKPSLPVTKSKKKKSKIIVEEIDY